LNDPVNQARLTAIRENRIARAPVGLDEIREGDFTWMSYGTRE
jgi:hypothetical protein